MKKQQCRHNTLQILGHISKFFFISFRVEGYRDIPSQAEKAGIMVHLGWEVTPAVHAPDRPLEFFN